MIEVSNLRKEFGAKVAVDGISFSVKKGEVLGFLGPNGAGKSTTMRMITGYLPPTSGTATVGGADIVEDDIEAKAKIGYLPENAPLYSDMSVEDFLRFCAEMRRVPADDIEAAVQGAIDTCFLEPVRHQSVDTLSKGYRHRTCLAQSIIHDPEVLILDEPTDGLDPNQKHEVRNLIRRWGKEKAIIFSTHILEEVEASCSRAIIIDRGKVIADGTPDQLKGKAAKAGSVLLRASGIAANGFRQELEKLSEVKKVVIEADAPTETEAFAARIFPNKGKAKKLGAAVSRLAFEKGLTINEMRVEEGRLDELFREITDISTT